MPRLLAWCRGARFNRRNVGGMAMRRALLRTFSAAAAYLACTLPATAHDIATPHTHVLPPVSVAAPETKPPKRVIKPKPRQALRPRGSTAARSDQPAASG